jgi:hypothetical protein
MLSRLTGRVRRFSTILPSGEKAERELSALEREFINIKEAEFSKLGLYRKEKTNEASLYKLFQLAQPRNKQDYSACVFAINHFYNFGVDISHHDFTNRWLATAIETSRVDEAVQIVKLWNTWLPCPPRIELVNILIGMVKIEQSRELLKSIRENWQIPLSPTAYTTVIAKEVGALTEESHDSLIEALTVWRDAQAMDVTLPTDIHQLLVEKLESRNLIDEAHEVKLVIQEQDILSYRS